MDPRRMFVGNMPYDADVNTLYAVLSEAGTVIDLSLAPDPTGARQHKGYGFIIYSTPEEAATAMATLNGRMVHGRPIRLEVQTGVGAMLAEQSMAAAAATALPPGVRRPQPARGPAAMAALSAAGGSMYGSGGGGGYGAAAALPPGGPVAGISPAGHPLVVATGASAALGHASSSAAAVATSPAVPYGPLPTAASAAAAASPLAPHLFTVRSAVDALSRAELVSIASEMKALASADAVAARALLVQYPSLTSALLMIEERLGMLRKGHAAFAKRPATTTTTSTSGSSAAAAASSGAGGAAAAATHPEASTFSSAAAGAAGAAAPASGSVGRMAVDASAGSAAPAVAAPPPPAAPPADDEDPATLIRAILHMSDAEVARQPPDQREMMGLVRGAVLTPLATLMTLPPAQRDELLQYRQQLQDTMGIVPVP